MEKLHVRPAEERDSFDIAKIHVGTWQHAYKGQVPDAYLDKLPESVQERAERWQKTIKRIQHGQKVFVAELGKNIAGFCIVNPCRDEDMDKATGEVGAIYVDASLIGKGVGSALMDAGLHFLKEEGFKTATLWVLKSHNKSREWYENKGWKLEGAEKTEDRGDVKLEEIRYIRKLEG